MRQCPKCKTDMKEDCYLENKARNLNDFFIIVKDEDFHKNEYPLKLAICPKCGHIEVYVEFKEEEKE